MHNIKIKVFSKTGYRCSLCGTYDNLKVTNFFPTWIRYVNDDIRNKIPICDTCKARRGVELLELGTLGFLPIEHRMEIMSYYEENRNLLRKYILSYGLYRTNNLLDLEHTKLVLRSYDVYLEAMR